MNNRGVEPRFDTLVEVDAVEYLAGRGVEAEGDVGEPQNGAHAGQFGLDTANALERLNTVATRLFHSRREGERERVDEHVGRLEAVALDGQRGDVPRGAQFPLRRSGLTLFVNAGRDHGGPEFGGERQEAVESGALTVTLFEVDGVEHRLATEPGQGLTRHFGFGGVDHDGHGRLGGETRHDLIHVTDPIGAGVVDADVEDVGALFDLVATNGHAGVPVALEHGVTELLRTVGVGALADHENGTVLLVGH